jgi:hypothetical protein
MKITQNQFVQLLSRNVGEIGVIVDMVNFPKLHKGVEALGVLTKHVTYTGVIGKSYSDVMDAGLFGEKKARKRTWGTLMENKYLVEHNDNYYLQLFIAERTVPVYKLNGEVVPLETARAWVDEREFDPIAVPIRDIKIENIHQIGLAFNCGTAHERKEIYEIV